MAEKGAATVASCTISPLQNILNAREQNLQEIREEDGQMEKVAEAMEAVKEIPKDGGWMANWVGAKGVEKVPVCA